MEVTYIRTDIPTYHKSFFFFISTYHKRFGIYLISNFLRTNKNNYKNEICREILANSISIEDVDCKNRHNT